MDGRGENAAAFTAAPPTAPLPRFRHDEDTVAVAALLRPTVVTPESSTVTAARTALRGCFADCRSCGASTTTLPLVSMERDLKKARKSGCSSSPGASVVQSLGNKSGLQAELHAETNADMCLEDENLLMEILAWLPAKELIKLTSVSKKWKSLISCKYFRLLHTRRRPKPRQSLILLDFLHRSFYFTRSLNGENKMAPYTITFPGKLHTLLQGCNGLLLLSSDFYKDFDDTYYVHNPATKQSNRITVPDNSEFRYVAAVSLAFDPLKSPYYKVVCIRSTLPPWESGDYTYHIQIYDSEFDKWRVVAEAFTSPLRLFFNSRAVICNETIYWSTSTCFNLVTNEIKTLPCPPDRVPDVFQDFEGWGFLQELDGRLFFFERPLILEEKVVVWELHDDVGGAQWIQNRELLIHRHHRKGNCYKILRYMGGGEEVPMCCLATHKEGNMSVYRFDEGVYEDVDDFPEQPGDGELKICIVYGFPFAEVLASV